MDHCIEVPIGIMVLCTRANFVTSFLGSGQYISRPETRRCFIQSLGVMKELRMLALEYSHIADGTGGALISLLPVLKRPNFRLQVVF